MKLKYIFYILVVLIVSSCAPISYTVSVDKKVPSVNNVDFNGKIPSVIALSQRGSTDSLYLSNACIGIAQSMEQNLSLDAGDVPVYFFYRDELDINGQGDIDFLYSYTGTDYIVVVDSLSVGDFEMSYPQQKGYYDGRYLAQSIISMPYRMNLTLYRNGVEGVSLRVHINEMESWLLMSEEPLPKVSALSKISDGISDSFITIGLSAAQEFFPSWESVNKRIYVYNNASWTQAYYYAYIFEWEKAMEIWLEETKSGNVKKRGYAAHNVSVACEILGMEELSRNWAGISKKLLGGTL